MDLDLHRLRHFVAVAEELHFGRAAERLHIAQPALSRQIRALEHDLGVALFDRDRRGTALTAAGKQLRIEATALLAAADAATRRVVAAGRATVTLTIGFMPGITVTPLTHRVRAANPELEIRLLRTDWDNQVSVLHDGRADVSIVRLPIDRRGLTVVPWFTEPRVAVLPADHRLAGEAGVELAELAAEHLVQNADAVPEWRDIAEEFVDVSRVEPPPQHSVEEKLELVAAGEGICVLPRSTGMFYTRADVVVVPITDIAPNEVCLAWGAAGDGSPHVRALVAAVDGVR